LITCPNSAPAIAIDPLEVKIAKDSSLKTAIEEASVSALLNMDDKCNNLHFLNSSSFNGKIN
jgi:hypothetical protein